MDDAKLMAMWSLTKNGKVLMSVPRVGFIRSILMNHMYHHRGQLSVYLRILDVPVPSIYGPSADEIRLSRSTVSIQPKPPSHRDIIGPSTYFRRSGICSICSRRPRELDAEALLLISAHIAGGRGSARPYQAALETA